jgi:peptidoglycan/LPS O-acetylase OafA/YrhL
VSAGPWFIGLWWMFSLGMALCWFMLGRLSRRGIVLVVGVTAVGCLAVDLVPGAISDPWHGQWAAWLTGVAILVLIVTKRVAQPFPRVVLWLGAVSYSLYLVHLPVIDTVVAGLWKLTPQSVPMAVGGVIVGAAVSLAAAALLRRWVEVPALRWSHRVRARAARPPASDPG